MKSALTTVDIEKIRKLIGNAAIEEAIDHLENATLNNPPLQSEITLAKSSWNNLKSQMFMTEEQKFVLRNGLTQSLLTVVRRLEQQLADSPKLEVGAKDQHAIAPEEISVVLSYSREDIAIAEQLRLFLNKHEIEIWFDQNIKPGEPFYRQITESISIAKAVVVLWSPSSIDSEWVYSEANMAAAQNKLIPILYDGVDATNLPLPFPNYHSIQMSDRDALVEAIKHKLQDTG